jgi:GT2 family glycosyltransferase
VEAVSVVVVAYEAGPALLRCLESLQGEDVAELIVVDNGSGGPEIQSARGLDRVRVLSPGENLGFAGGCNLGAREATGETLVFLNPDTEVAPGAMRALAAALELPEVGIAMPRLRMLEQPALLNSGGNILHLTGLSWPGLCGRPAEEVDELHDVPLATGAAFAIPARTFWALGGFTEELFLYHEDVDLSWRARMQGLRIVVTPDADVYHAYRFKRRGKKYYYLERNRLVFVLCCFSPRLLLAVAPVLVATEMGIVLLALKGGWLKPKLAAWAWCGRNASWLIARRREVQGQRKVPDRELARFISPVLETEIDETPAVARTLNPVLKAYWSLARRAL